MVIPFLHPSKADRRELLPALARQVGRKFRDGVDLDELARRSELKETSARALQEVLVSAGLRADAETGVQGTALHRAHLDAAIADRLDTEDPRRIQLMAARAIQACSSVSLLPWMDAEAGGGATGEVPSYLAGIVDAKTGRLDPARLGERIAELERG